MKNTKNSRLTIGLLSMLVVGSIAPTATANAPEPASTSPLKEASVRFERGVKLFEDGDYKLSLVEFRRSYQSVPDYRTLYNIGQVEFQLGNFANARRTLQRYLEEGGNRIPAPRRADVERDLEALRIRTAFLHVVVNVDGAEVRLDGERIGASPFRTPLLVNGGAHVVAVSKPGHITATQDITLAGGEEKTVSVGLAPIHDDQRDTKGGLAWVGWGVTGALVAGTVGMGVAWESARADLAATKSGPTSRSELDQKAESVDARRAITIGLGGAALVAAGISTYLTVAGRSRAATPSTRGVIPSRIAASPFGLSGSF